MKIPDENGKLRRADTALENATPEEGYDKGIKAAVNCFARRGG